MLEVDMMQRYFQRTSMLTARMMVMIPWCILFFILIKLLTSNMFNFVYTHCTSINWLTKLEQKNKLKLNYANLGKLKIKIM